MLNFKEKISGIGGWLSEKEGVFLYEAAKKISAELAIVEIGSWKGRSTVCLGLGSRDGGKAKVYAIDPHTGSSEHKKMFGTVDTFQEFLSNIKVAEVESAIVPIRDYSENVAKEFNKPIGLLFIDGAHEYKYASQDFELWFPNVTDGGLIAFHDAWQFIGPRLASVKALLTSRVKNPKLFDTITVFKKTSQVSLMVRVWNIMFLVYRFFAGYKGWRNLSEKGSFLNK